MSQMCYSVTLCQKVKKIKCQKVVEKVVKKLSKCCQIVVPRPSASASLTGRRQKVALHHCAVLIALHIGYRGNEISCSFESSLV
jgi:hypothetical protein